MNGVCGVILLPDDWSANIFNLNNANTYNSSFSSNTITATQWITLENAGAVFLPAASRRDGAYVQWGSTMGYYWTTSSAWDNNGQAYIMYMSMGDFGYSAGDNRCAGLSVRLVHDAQ